MNTEKYRLGMIGLGTMGRSLLLNMADHGFAVSGYDQDAAKLALLDTEGKGRQVKGFARIQDFVESLNEPRVVMLLVPAGKIVDAVIEELIPLLSTNDIIIDGGNSYFKDTEIRVKYLEERGLHFFGMGVSGGEEGARKGPSMMPGGDMASYQFVQPVMEAIAAKVNDEPCVTYIGPGASGHFVKMVHNGIEYALMQLIADAYEILRKGLGLHNEQIQQVFAGWNEGKLNSYLLEITAEVFAYKNEDGSYLIDEVKDEARSKGTGKWTTQVATDLELPIPTIDLAVSMRNLSKYKSLRIAADETFVASPPALAEASPDVFLTTLEDAYYFAIIQIYAQGMHLLSKASGEYQYNLKPGQIARIWRGGCIIRAGFLEQIYQAYHHNEHLEHLLLDPGVAAITSSTLPSAREVVVKCMGAGISIPAFASTISYFDAITSSRLPNNLTQAQRDYFGAHTYERIGKEGVFHTEWKAV